MSQASPLSRHVTPAFVGVSMHPPAPSHCCTPHGGTPGPHVVPDASNRHVPEQQSPLTVFPSSQSSTPTFTTPSPHTFGVQSFLHASVSIALPSSHCSPGSTTPSPHVVPSAQIPSWVPSLYV